MSENPDIIGGLSAAIRRAPPPAPTPRRSELWQRIRAAREHAKLTANEVAKALGKSRSAISLWESKDPGNRTRPNVEDMAQLALLCRVSLKWLVDDSSDPMTVTPYAPGAVAPVKRTSPGRDAAASFWYSVRHALIDEYPGMSECFEVPLGGAFTHLKASFLAGRTVAAFMYDVGDAEQDALLLRQAADLLLTEVAIGFKLRKIIAVWTRTGRYDSPVGRELAARGFEFECVNEVGAAVKLLASAVH